MLMAIRYSCSSRISSTTSKRVIPSSSMIPRYFQRAFLRSLRYQLAGAPDAAAFLREHYGHLDEARRQQLAAYYTDADGMALQSPLTLGDIAHWVEQALEATRQGA